MNATPKFRLRWYQYRLRSLLILMVLVSLGMSWFAVKMQQAKRQGEAVKQIKKLGGTVGYDWQDPALGKTEPSGPAWIRKLLGEDFFAAVVLVSVHAEGSDDDLEHLKGLAQLRKLDLRGTRVTGTGWRT